MLFFTTVCAAADQAPGARASISPEQVTGAIAAAGLSVSSSQVEFLSLVSADDPDVGLQVTSVDRFTDNSIKVRLRCRDHHSCLPFYVLVRDVSPPASTPILVPAREGGAHAEGSNAVPGSKPLIQRGQPAVLILEGAAARIRLRVICLQDGETGQRIRVSSADRKHFYQGTVVAAGVLKGSW